MYLLIFLSFIGHMNECSLVLVYRYVLMHFRWLCQISNLKTSIDSRDMLLLTLSIWIQTVMTTVGYGNQAVSSTAGRSMVYSLGFLSLLVFAAILARSGQIVSAIWDDILANLHWHYLMRPWPSSFMWGTCYYMWMLVIAGHTVQWKRERLEDSSFGLNDGYWFAYISTTTIGLGDIFLEPEVIVARDLLVFPFSFLVGFTFLSAFLGKLAEAMSNLYWTKNRPMLVESMLGRLKKTELGYGTGAIAGISDQVVDQTKCVLTGTADPVVEKANDAVQSHGDDMAPPSDQ